MINMQDIENFIQDTTEHEDPAVDASAGVGNERITCTCGVQFSSCDEGVSTLLKKCRNCYDSLRYDLETLENPGEATDERTHPTEDNAVEEEQTAPSENVPVIPAAAAGALTYDELTGAMTMAISDAKQTFVLDLNGKKETFVYDFDPINSSRSRKIFKRTSWTHKELYWYNVFGAMHSNKGPIITPCAVQLTNGSTVVLIAILETMCNRPRYDAIVYDPSSKIASIEKYFFSQFNKLDTHFAIDLEAMETYVYHELFSFYIYV